MTDPRPWSRLPPRPTSRPTADGSPLGGLKRMLAEEPRAKIRPGERCEMCGVSIPEEHSHVVNVHDRALLCACRACYLLFTHDGAGQGRFRAVPDRYRYDPAFALTNAQWDDLQIPVAMAFFFINASLDRFVAFYPSPAGATESLLPLETWDEILAANPWFADVAPDVEALLIHRTDGVSECYLAPISACYELVGHVRLKWRGFAGGEEVWREIGTFFAGLRERSGDPVGGRSGE